MCGCSAAFQVPPTRHLDTDTRFPHREWARSKYTHNAGSLGIGCGSDGDAAGLWHELKGYRRVL